MKYKMNLGGSTLIVDVPQSLSVLRDLDQMFSRAQTTESAAHRRPKPPRYDLIGGVKITPAPRQTKKRAPQPVIVITSDGVTTTATRRIGKAIQAIATAKCNPGDRFDFEEGARIAFERLCGRDPFPEKPEGATLGVRSILIDRLRGEMKNRGLTMRALSLELGVPYTTLQGWMTGGKFPRPDTYDRITQWLDAEGE